MREETVGRGTWDVSVLGPLQVSRAGRLLPLGSRQQRAVLAVLVCSTGRVVSRGSLVDALWGRTPPPGATASIQTHVSRLRQILEPERAPGAAPTVIVTQAAGYRLTIPDTAIDATRFQGLLSEGVTLLDERRAAAALASFDAALSLWRGDVLGDLTGYAFVVPVAAGLDEIHSAAQEGRIQALMDQGRDAAALGELDRLLATHPLREGLHAQRMLTLYRAGRQSEALEAYRQLRSRLDEQLGLDPSPAVQDLQGRILRHDPALTGPAPASSAARPQPAGQDATVSATVRTFTPTRAAVPPGKRPTTVPSEVPAPPPGRGGETQATWRASVSRSRRMLVALLACAALTITVVSADATVGNPRLVEGNTIGVLDSSGDVVGAIPAGTSPVGPAYGGGAIWVASESDGTVTRVDPATGTITQRFEVGHNPSAITATDQDVWVANAGDGTVTRINIAANRITPPAIQVGTQPAALSVGGGGVWVANSGDNTVQRIEERTGHPGPAVDVGDGPDGVLVDETSVWVANGRDGTVSHLDATTGVEISSPVQVGAGARGLARVGDELWVTEELSQSVSRINLALNQVHPIYVGPSPT